MRKILNIRRVLCCLILGLTAVTDAGEFNETLSIGDVGPAWKDLPGVDGKRHSLTDLKDKPVVVVVFTCNSCPVATDYEDRIIKVARNHGDKVAVVAINVNTVAEDRLPQMMERAQARKFPFPYLYDESQKIGKAYGATFTPEFFVLDRDRKVVYMGGMDDNSDPDAVKKNYLEPAIEAAMNKTVPAVKETVAIGCRVRYTAERRKKREAAPEKADPKP